MSVGVELTLKVVTLGKSAAFMQDRKVNTVRRVTVQRRVSTERVLKFYGAAGKELDIASRPMRVPRTTDGYLFCEGKKEAIRSMVKSDTSMVKVSD